MNDYDDSDDYSSANSFRARSNTWPLNRPDFVVPNGVCIDETLPEIELEEDDLFTTSENWATGLVDHDIMSWDPILNAQHQQQQQVAHQNINQQQSQATTIHHHHQPQQIQQPVHLRQQSIHQVHQQAQPSSHHHHQPHDSLLSGPTIIMGNGPTGGQQTMQQQQQPQQQHQQLPPPPPPQQTQSHPTLNNSHCLDSDDTSDYHIQQLHHLRLDSNQAPSEQQQHYVSSLSSPMCLQGSNTTIGNDTYNISSDNHQQPQHHHHHHLQPLTSARYDLDQQHDFDTNNHNDEYQQSHHQQHHHHHHQTHHQQLHHLTSSGLDNHSTSSHMLSSSLSTGGIGLGGDLEDLDYKSVDPSQILQNSSYDDQEQQQHDSQQQQQSQLGDASGNEVKQSNSTSSTKIKLNTPRRNAWGNMSYADLISQAIDSTNDKRLTLSQIYDWMVQHVPYFKDKGDSNSSAGWKNSVRHNLSLHNRFKRLQNEGTGKSSWWTINPEANVGKCARRRAASMEASKYEKKRGRAKKRAEAIRQGLISYPSLTNSSLNGSTSTLDQQQHLTTSLNQFGSTQQGAQPKKSPQPTPQPQQQLVHQVEQYGSQQVQQDKVQQPQQQIAPALTDQYGTQQAQQQQHSPPSQQLQQQDGSTLNNTLQQTRQPDTGLYVTPSQEPQYEQKDNKMQQQPQQQSQYYYHFELSTAL